MQATNFQYALQSSEHWIVVFISLVLCGLVVVLHYEVLNRLNGWLPHMSISRRARVLVSIFIILGAHVAEVWIFAIGVFLCTLDPAMGQVAGIDGLGLFDAVYLSVATFTTVGYGDISPLGPLRFLMGCESLTGFVLITWSASFTYLEMERYWPRR
ncbi:MAG: potassium channel family protein [Xanthomonadales bacterium]|jgi:hypothetical protein|nr:potassium channel family protein [Xanthomonadales bacterium]